MRRKAPLVSALCVTSLIVVSAWFLCEHTGYSVANGDSYGTIMFKGGFDEVYISGDGRNWYKVNSEIVRFKIDSGRESGVYSLLYRIGKDWYISDVVVSNGNNEVELSGIKNYGLDRSYVHGRVLYNDNNSIDIKKDIDCYVIVYNDEWYSSDKVIDVARNENRLGKSAFSFVPSNHWTRTSTKNMADIFSKEHNLVGTVNSLPDNIEDAIISLKNEVNRIRDDNNTVAGIDMNTLILIFLVVFILIFLFRK